MMLAHMFQQGRRGAAVDEQAVLLLISANGRLGLRTTYAVYRPTVQSTPGERDLDIVNGLIAGGDGRAGRGVARCGCGGSMLFPGRLAEVDLILSS